MGKTRTMVGQSSMLLLLALLSSATLGQSVEYIMQTIYADSACGSTEYSKDIYQCNTGCVASNFRDWGSSATVFENHICSSTSFQLRFYTDASCATACDPTGSLLGKCGDVSGDVDTCTGPSSSKTAYPDATECVEYAKYTYHSTSEYIRSAMYAGTTCSGPVILGGVIPEGVCRPDDRICTGSTLSVPKFEKFTFASGTITSYKCENGATDGSCAATHNCAVYGDLGNGLGFVSYKSTEGVCASGNSGISSTSSDSGMGAGVLIAIIIGALVVVGVIGAVLYFKVFKSNESSADNKESDTVEVKKDEVESRVVVGIAMGTNPKTQEL